VENVRHMNRADGPELDAERFVLGGCMHDPRAIPAVRGILIGSDFAQPAHELIWNTLTALYDQGEPTTPLAVRIALDRTGDLTRVGGATGVFQLADHAGGDPAWFADQVRAAADLRAEADLGRRIVQKATAPDAEPGTAVTLIDTYLQRRAERAAGRSGDPADALLAELLDTSALDNMPTLEPLVGDLLHLDSLARIIGPSGHMKSFVTIDLAAHIGTGKPWHGHHVRQGTVVYLVAEGHRGIRKRIRAWEKHHGLRMDNVLFLPRPVQARGPEWDTWIEAMRRLAPSMIVIDTQARVSVGVEENSNTELGIVIERLDDLRRATGACVLVIHHTGHIGEHGRGASAAKGALQSEMHVSKKGENARNIIVTLKVGKQKDDEESGDIQFGLRVVPLDGEAKPDGRPVTSVVLESLDVAAIGPVPGTAAFIAQQLDRAGVPSHYGRDRLRSECIRLSIQARTELLAEVARIRKHKIRQNGTEHLSPNLSQPSPPEPDPIPGTGTAETPDQTCPGQDGDSTGQAAGPTCPLPPPLGRGQVEQPGPPCTVCARPIPTDWATRGYDTHLACDPRTGSHPAPATTAATPPPAA
jgi:hypothetical protein